MANTILRGSKLFIQSLTRNSTFVIQKIRIGNWTKFSPIPPEHWKEDLENEMKKLKELSEEFHKQGKKIKIKIETYRQAERSGVIINPPLPDYFEKFINVGDLINGLGTALPEITKVKILQGIISRLTEEERKAEDK